MKLKRSISFSQARSLPRALAVLICLLCVTISLTGCGKKQPQIEAKVQYFIEELVPYTMPYNMVKDNDRTFLEFDEGFKRMAISFDTLNGRQPLDFVVTSFAQKKGNINATVSRIETDGKLVRYSVYSNSTTIFLKTLTTYQTRTVVDNKAVTVDVERNKDVALFHRTTPRYITVGGAA